MIIPLVNIFVWVGADAKCVCTYIRTHIHFYIQKDKNKSDKFSVKWQATAYNTMTGSMRMTQLYNYNQVKNASENVWQKETK